MRLAFLNDFDQPCQCYCIRLIARILVPSLLPFPALDALERGAERATTNKPTHDRSTRPNPPQSLRALVKKKQKKKKRGEQTCLARVILSQHCYLSIASIQGTTDRPTDRTARPKATKPGLLLPGVLSFLFSLGANVGTQERSNIATPLSDTKKLQRR